MRIRAGDSRGQGGAPKALFYNAPHPRRDSRGAGVTGRAFMPKPRLGNMAPTPGL
jgi:hypothetical protein